MSFPGLEFFFVWLTDLSMKEFCTVHPKLQYELPINVPMSNLSMHAQMFIGNNVKVIKTPCYASFRTFHEDDHMSNWGNYLSRYFPLYHTEPGLLVRGHASSRT